MGGADKEGDRQMISCPECQFLVPDDTVTCPFCTRGLGESDRAEARREEFATVGAPSGTSAPSRAAAIQGPAKELVDGVANGMAHSMANASSVAQSMQGRVGGNRMLMVAVGTALTAVLAILVGTAGVALFGLAEPVDFEPVAASDTTTTTTTTFVDPEAHIELLDATIEFPARPNSLDSTVPIDGTPVKTRQYTFDTGGGVGIRALEIQTLAATPAELDAAALFAALTLDSRLQQLGEGVEVGVDRTFVAAGVAESGPTRVKGHVVSGSQSSIILMAFGPEEAVDDVDALAADFLNAAVFADADETVDHAGPADG